jgi:hypothetical protein
MELFAVGLLAAFSVPLGLVAQFWFEFLGLCFLSFLGAF